MAKLNRKNSSRLKALRAKFGKADPNAKPKKMKQSERTAAIGKADKEIRRAARRKGAAPDSNSVFKAAAKSAGVDLSPKPIKPKAAKPKATKAASAPKAPKAKAASKPKASKPKATKPKAAAKPKAEAAKPKAAKSEAVRKYPARKAILKRSNTAKKQSSEALTAVRNASPAFQGERSPKTVGKSTAKILRQIDKNRLKAGLSDVDAASKKKAAKAAKAKAAKAAKVSAPTGGKMKNAGPPKVKNTKSKPKATIKADGSVSIGKAKSAPKATAAKGGSKSGGGKKGGSGGGGRKGGGGNRTYKRDSKGRFS